MEEFGLGQQLLELEKLKKKLAAEGLFDESRKREINIYPKAIGVITAPNGAAIRDIVTNIKRRYPIADIYVFPSLVQGEQAPAELLKAFNESQKYDLDTLIIGRGGGASEDLSAFNDEKLVRAVSTSKMPIIAAVNKKEAAGIEAINKRNIGRSIKEDLLESLQSKVEDQRSELEHLKVQLELLNPKGILSRGYSISVDEKGKPISSVIDLSKDKEVRTILKDGEFTSVVKEIKGE